MYQEFYGLRGPSFTMTPDARFFFPSTVHRRAYAHLVYGLAQNEGFIVATGEVGSGKTTLIEQLSHQLDPETYAVARIVTAQLSGDDLLRLVAAAFGAPPGGDKAAVLRGLMQVLRGEGPCANTPKRRHILMVDEAQGLSVSALEELRMLSNITDGGRALLQTVLLGQPQFRHTLARPELEQLRQRVLASYHLGPLSLDDTRAYVEHRMRAVGWTGQPSWQDGALELVYRHSGGIPRRINRLCSRVLLGGALAETWQLTSAMVETTAVELESDLGDGGPEDAEMARGVGDVARSFADGASDDASGQVRALATRLDALERQVARLEQAFGRVLDLFAQKAVRP